MATVGGATGGHRVIARVRSVNKGAWMCIRGERKCNMGKKGGLVNQWDADV